MSYRPSKKSIMPEASNKNNHGDYDTAINIIGGLKDCNILSKVIASHFNEDDTLNDLITETNEFNIRTEKSRVRIKKAINSVFLQFKNEHHQDLIKTIFIDNAKPLEKELMLFWHFSLNNRLFREISTTVFSKAYYSGRIGLSKDDIIAYLKALLAQNKSLNLNWSETTISTLATKYLNFMTKLNFLEGGRNKSFRHIKPTAQSIVLFLYLAKLHDPENNNILTNDLLPLSFVALEDIQDRLKKLSLKGYFNMNFNGVALNIELTHSYKGICDAIFN